MSDFFITEDVRLQRNTVDLIFLDKHCFYRTWAILSSTKCRPCKTGVIEGVIREELEDAFAYGMVETVDGTQALGQRAVVQNI